MARSEDPNSGRPGQGRPTASGGSRTGGSSGRRSGAARPSTQRSGGQRSGSQGSSGQRATGQRSGQGPAGQRSGGQRSGQGPARAAGGRTGTSKATRSPSPAARKAAPRQTANRPSGPDRGTFARRRAIVLVLALALLAAVGVGVKFGLDALGSGSAKPAPTQTTTPTGPSTEQLANPVECTTEAAGLTMDLPALTLTGGQAASIPVTITNNGQVPCVVSMDRTALEVVLTSGADRVWSSSDCGLLPEKRTLLLDVGKADTTTISWPGTRSAAGCAPDQPAAGAGTYTFTATLTLDGAGAVATVAKPFQVG